MTRYMKTIITLTLIHDVALQVTAMGHADLAREMEEGEAIGAMELVSSTPIPDGEIRRELMAVGNDGEFFDLTALDDEPSVDDDNYPEYREDSDGNETFNS